MIEPLSSREFALRSLFLNSNTFWRWQRARAQLRPRAASFTWHSCIVPAIHLRSDLPEAHLVVFSLLDYSFLTSITSLALGSFGSLFAATLLSLFDQLLRFLGWTGLYFTLVKVNWTRGLISLRDNELLHRAILVLFLWQCLPEGWVVLEAQGGVFYWLHYHVLFACEVEGAYVTATFVVEIHIHLGDCACTLFPCGNTFEWILFLRPFLGVDLRRSRTWAFARMGRRSLRCQSVDCLSLLLSCAHF
jgi:hypothetical protein